MQSFSGIGFLNSLKPWNGQGGFGLESIREAAHRWGNPQSAIPAIHIAGTNGKGSVATYVSSCLGASGARVGLTTSPHLTSINERIVIDGLPIDDHRLDRAALELRELLRFDDLELSFFEAITLIFFAICREERLDFMVVEVGLGGRLDATNILSSPLVGAIVSIGLDHTEILGNSEAEIAREKSGIIKPGMTVVSGLLSDQAMSEVEGACSGIGAKHLHLTRDFKLDNLENGVPSCILTDERRIKLRPRLQGAHQLRNAAVAAQIAAIAGLDEGSIQTGIENAVWPGRLEEFEVGGVNWLLDAGHNPQGIKTLVEYLENKSIQDITCIFGAINTKDWKEMVSLLMPFVRRWLVLEPRSNAAVSSAQIVEFLSGHGVRAESFGSDYSHCLTQVLGESGGSAGAYSGAESRTPVVVAGSIYMLGAIRRSLGVGDPPLWIRSPVVRETGT